MSAPQPRVSVVVEGYNESLALGTAADTMQGLAAQDFPLDQVEVVLVGSAAQAEAWRRTYASGSPFLRVRTVAAPGAHYYALKNEGAGAATGDVVAMIDSDARPAPGWLAALVAALDGGADVSAGVTLFRFDDGRGGGQALLQVAASISWGFVVARDGGSEPAAAGFLSHNVGFRAATRARHPYRTDLGRTCAGSFLYKALRESGARIAFTPRQRVEHAFSLRWWVQRLHRRFGYEVYLLRRLDEAQRRPWLEALQVLEPPLTMLWKMALDVPVWLRFAKLLDVPLWRRVALLPLLVAMSFLARGSELIGMYRTMAAPEAMKRFAESN